MHSSLHISASVCSCLFMLRLTRIRNLLNHFTCVLLNQSLDSGLIGMHDTGNTVKFVCRVSGRGLRPTEIPKARET